MHPAFSTRGAQRRRFVSNSVRARDPVYIVQLTIDADALTSLRQLVVSICGTAFEYMRVACCHEAGKVKVCLCLKPPAVAMVIDAVRRRWPAAQFGLVVEPAMQVAQ